MSLPRIGLLLALGLSASPALTPASAGVPENSPKATTRSISFQEFQASGLPRGWEEDTAVPTDLARTFAADGITEENPVARITLQSIRRGPLRILGPSLPLRQGWIYTLQLRAKAAPDFEPALPVEIGFLRPQSSPRTWVFRQTLRPPRQWQTLSFSFQSPETLPDARLTIALETAGSLWLDRIEVTGETAAAHHRRLASAVRPGNLVPNGEFRLGPFGWATLNAVDRATQYPEHYGRQYSLDPPAFTLATGQDGQPMGVVELETWSATLMSTMFSVSGGVGFRAQTRLRLTSGTRQVRFRVFSPAWPTAPELTQEVGTAWTEFTLEGLPPTALDLRCEINAQGGGPPGRLEIAAVSLAQREPPASPHPPPQFGVTADRAMPVYGAGEKPALQLHAAGLGDAAQVVRWKIVDADGVQVRAGQWRVKEGGTNIPWNPTGVGWYQLRWQAPWTQNRPEGSLALAIVPPTPRVPADQSPFGVHVEGCRLGLDKMRFLGARWLRLHQPLWTKWPAIQPGPKTWRFPDEEVRLFSAAGIGLVGSLDRTPAWASREPSRLVPGTDFHGFYATLPADWRAWREYVRQVVRRYRQQIQFWEIWNEPDIPFLLPPPNTTQAEAFHQLLRNSAPVIRKENPSAKILASPAYVLKRRHKPEGYQPDFTERLIELGAMKDLDIFGIHHYLNQGPRWFDQPEKFADPLARIRQAFLSVGRDPVWWNTEWGFSNFVRQSNGVDLPADNGLSPAQAAQELVAWSAGQLAAGFTKLFWYDGQDNYYYHWHVTKSLFEYREPTPAFLAYAVLTKALDGLAYVGERPGPAGLRIFLFGPASDRVEIAYGPPGSPASLPLPKGRLAIDYLGRARPADPRGNISLQAGPVYLLPPSRASAVLGDPPARGDSPPPPGG